MKIHLIAAARPNFMKIAPLFHELNRNEGLEPVIVHTGQHYDLNMSDIFFQDFNLPNPHIHLGVGSGTHAEQTGNVMIAYEKILMQSPPDLVVVVGDVNSTVAATLAAVKLGIKTAHLEAGLRSFDRTMPEEINRLVTDSIADYLWTPSPDGDENLLNEGVSEEKIVRVGNIMIDSFEMLRSEIEALDIFTKFNVRKREYGVVTLHRPSNVDSGQVLETLCRSLCKIAEQIPIIFPAHPRTLGRLEETGFKKLLSDSKYINLVAPMGYKEFMNLVMNSRMIITDSGGVQEETTYLKIPCLTLRSNTERPITVTEGSNQLCSSDTLLTHVHKLLQGKYKNSKIPELWDGKTAERVVNCIKQIREGVGS
ncbi:non-hydrolyzing UDP-N-acetylglucosamine 2-epimerase [Thermodesulfobacteriota bacterium]